MAMTFLFRPGTPRYQEQLRIRALDAARIASDLVRARWDLYRTADRAARRAAFAAYLAALDHEAEIAAELEGLSLRPLSGAA